MLEQVCISLKLAKFRLIFAAWINIFQFNNWVAGFPSYLCCSNHCSCSAEIRAHNLFQPPSLLSLTLTLKSCNGFQKY